MGIFGAGFTDEPWQGALGFNPLAKADDGTNAVKKRIKIKIIFFIIGIASVSDKAKRMPR